LDEAQQDVDTQDLGTRNAETRPSDTAQSMGTPSSTDEVTMRFGPGVPERLAGVWREGQPRKRPLARRVFGGLLTLGLAVLSGLVVWWLLHQGGPVAKVTGVAVEAPAGVQHCDATAVVVGVIHTNGGRGDVSYRWRRSDGQNSGVFTDTMPRGKDSIRVPLRWTVKGPGSLHAVATLEVISPKTPAGTASGSFDYTCG
jgi:hypothetical protein